MTHLTEIVSLLLFQVAAGSAIMLLVLLASFPLPSAFTRVIGILVLVLFVLSFVATSVGGPVRVLLYNWGPHSWFLQCITLALSILLLGTVLVGLILGHWYLTEPRLPLAPLVTIAWTLVSLTGLHLLVSGVNMASAPRSLPGPSSALLILLSWSHLFVGVLGPAVLAGMILGTVRVRSTMAATGLLYITLLFVLAGEAIAGYFLLSQAVLL